MDTPKCRLVSLLLQRAMRLLPVFLCCLIFATLAQAEDQTFIVPGASGNRWFDTQLDIAPGTLLRIAAVGEVDGGEGRVYVPQGTRTFVESAGFPAETRYRYGLVARLTTRLENPGASGDGLFEQWAYGQLPGNRYCAASGGHLWFTVNDNRPSDNHGAFTVILTLGTCRSEAEQARQRVNLYATDGGLSPTRTFRSGDPIVLRIENNTESSIYLRTALDRSRLIREEGLQIERATGSGFVPILPSGRGPDGTTTDNGDGTKTKAIFDYALTALVELRSTMNINRRWSVISPDRPGTYRLSLVYYDSRNTQTPRHTIYSPTFEVQ